MKKILFFVIGFTASLIIVLQGYTAEEEPHFFSHIPPRASVFGKYSGLKQRLYCPDELYKMTFHNNLRNFHDLGYTAARNKWCDDTLEPGYLVYYGGIWYVWEKQVLKEQSHEVLATMNGTYTDLIKKKHCRYMKTKGRFIEFGYISSPMCGNPNKPDTGFFVYVHPHVYIYKNKIIPLKHVPEEAGVGGRYTDLFNVIRCDSQGEYKYDGKKMKESGVTLEYDEEDQRASLWPDYCGESLGPGHYVYRFPYWYAWRTRRAESGETESLLPPRE